MKIVSRGENIPQKKPLFKDVFLKMDRKFKEEQALPV